MAVAIIPARGGSKGVPGKNLARVGGRSLVARSVAAALGAATVDVVVVSSDDEAILAEAERAGAVPHRRPVELAGDTASSESALLDVLDGPGADADVVAFLQCTSPFTTAADVDAIVAPVLADEADAAFATIPFHGFLWAPEGAPVGHPVGRRPRRQDLPAQLLETGAVYAMRATGLRASGSRFHGRIRPVATDPARWLEIDEPGDLARARALAPLLDRLDLAPVPRPALLVLDFDGVVTDDRVLTLSDGTEGVLAHRGDGRGLAALRDAVPVLVLSAEVDGVVAARCRKLGLETVQGVQDKRSELVRILTERGLDATDVAYVGNDVNDLGCMELVGLPVAVADAHPDVLGAAGVVLTRPGGRGAVRELADRMLGDTAPTLRG